MTHLLTFLKSGYRNIVVRFASQVFACAYVCFIRVLVVLIIFAICSLLQICQLPLNATNQPYVQVTYHAIYMKQLAVTRARTYSCYIYIIPYFFCFYSSRFFTRPELSLAFQLPKYINAVRNPDIRLIYTILRSYLNVLSTCCASIKQSRMCPMCTTESETV